MVQRMAQKLLLASVFYAFPTHGVDAVRYSHTPHSRQVEHDGSFLAPRNPWDNPFNATDGQDFAGGVTKEQIWKKVRSNAFSYTFAIVWISLIALLPLMLHFVAFGFTAKLTKTQIVESVVLYAWLIGGLFLFTNVLVFQSPHFDGEIRSLDLEEAVYLFAQIITTVGYGDIIPATPRCQVFIAIFVLFSFLLIAAMISQLAGLIEEIISKHFYETDLTPRAGITRQDAGEIAMRPLINSIWVFLTIFLIGVVFYTTFPGENKTFAKAVYMALVTLTTVGFGAVTPVTRGGMVFGAFWMLFGVSASGSLISATTAWVSSLKKWELMHDHLAKTSPRA
eukprot:TRINITY_DN12872_c0_g1_i1.p1 TRINITY_DN12872_c0_g1~~TRINITY_DN12872_c0_g1_i1.p1  ORF type:complete len:337 (+),score=39.88 TRINITY_DN12872_c0_g1_i1:104-1114(+)